LEVLVVVELQQLVVNLVVTMVEQEELVLLTQLQIQMFQSLVVAVVEHILADQVDQVDQEVVELDQLEMEVLMELQTLVVAEVVDKQVVVQEQVQQDVKTVVQES
jgi:hypothetical protein